MLEGVPGLGKTLLVRTLADALTLKFQRIQFTPDFMPADLIGTNVVLETPKGGRRSEFQQGPIFANLVLADQPRKRIVIVTDGGFPELDAIKGAEGVTIVPIGKRTGNVAITRFQARRSLIDPIGYQILAEVQNASDAPVESRFELDLEGKVIDVVPIKLAPRATWTQVFEKTSADGGRRSTRRQARPERRPRG